MTLAGFLLTMWRRSDFVRGSDITFVIETIALVFFGMAVRWHRELGSLN